MKVTVGDRLISYNNVDELCVINEPEPPSKKWKVRYLGSGKTRLVTKSFLSKYYRHATN